VESVFGLDIPTGRQLTADEIFDRGVLGTGAIAGILLSGYGASSTFSARLAAAAKSGNALASALLTEIPTFGIERALQWDIGAAATAFGRQLSAGASSLGSQLWYDLRYAPRNGIIANPFLFFAPDEAPLYEVGLAKNLRDNPLHGIATDTIAEHVPQSKWGRQLIPGFREVNNVGYEPAIRLSVEEANVITEVEKLTQVPASAREALAIKIQLLRIYTEAPNAALQDLIALSKKLHPEDYFPLHRTP
jgi:hypothetical protein